jgi:hypothetical protein
MKSSKKSCFHPNATDRTCIPANRAGVQTFYSQNKKENLVNNQCLQGFF